MPLPSPDLDNRTFEQLVEEARRRVQQISPGWTDLTPSDPGMVLLELFAHLTQTLIQRLNRLPDKAYVEFLRLIGVRIHPTAAASATLRFTRSRPGNQPLDIPRGTRVTVSRAESGQEPPIFVTVRQETIPANQTQVETVAYNCELIDGELAGNGTGQPGLSIRAARPPIIAPTSDQLDLVVGVEVLPDQVNSQMPVIQHRDKVYRIWREVDTFANLGADRYVYVVDRVSGIVNFGPSARVTKEDGTLTDTSEALAEVVPADREVRLWYRSGGGSQGNVAANTLTVLRDPIPGVEVTNPAPSAGG